MAYKFVRTASDVKPTSDNITLLEKSQVGHKLTRAEKDRIAEILYDTFSQHSPIFKYMGWLWNLRHLPRILVKTKEYGWQEYYAPDKTSLRKVLPYRIIEMVYL